MKYSWTVMDMITREESGFLTVPGTVPIWHVLYTQRIGLSLNQ